MHQTPKERIALERRIKSMRGRTEGMGKINDWKTRKAKEDFHRPAFQGTELEKKND